MCEGMAIANVLQNITCPKKNDNRPSEQDPILNDQVGVGDYVGIMCNCDCKVLTISGL